MVNVNKGLYRNFSCNMWPWIVVFQFEVLVLEVKDGLDVWIYYHARQRTWCARQLEMYLFQVVLVDVCIAQGMDEITGFQASNLCHHL